MTFREKLLKENHMDPLTLGTPVCPRNYGYEDISPCNANLEMSCSACWNREIPGTEPMWPKENPHILDSGERTEFETGAVRDIQKGKGRCDLMPLEVVSEYLILAGLHGKYNKKILSHIDDFKKNGITHSLYMAIGHFVADAYDNCDATMLLEIAKHFEEGAEKYGEDNWQKGLPAKCYINSAIRHYLKWLRGDQDEPHDRAFVWNLMCCIWEVDYSPRSLNELVKGESISDPETLKEKAEDALREAEGESNQGFIEMKMRKHPYACRLGDYPHGLFEFGGDIYAKTSVLSTYIYVIATRVNDGARKVLNPDLVVGTIEITEE